MYESGRESNSQLPLMASLDFFAPILQQSSVRKFRSCSVPFQLTVYHASRSTLRHFNRLHRSSWARCRDIVVALVLSWRAILPD